MPDVLFHLHNYARKDGTRAIYARVNLPSKPLILVTGFHAPARCWDAGRRRCKRGQYEYINSALDRFAEAINDAIVASIQSGALVPSADDVRMHLDRMFSRMESTGIGEDFRRFLEYKARSATPDSIMRYKSSYARLAEWRPKLSWADITESGYADFCAYLAGQGLMTNGIGAVLKHLVVFFRWAAKQGCAVPDSATAWRKITERIDIVTLTSAELEQIRTVELPPGLEFSRRLFVLQCSCGLRFSDVSRLRPEWVQGDFLIAHTRKTRTAVRIPLTSALRAALAAMDEIGYRRISAQRYNENVERISKIAGLTTPIVRVRHSLKARHEETLEKWQLITSHTARRTFITLSLERGVRPEVLMRITGHTNLATLMKYVEITANVARDEMTKAWG